MGGLRRSDVARIRNTVRIKDVAVDETLAAAAGGTTATTTRP